MVHMLCYFSLWYEYEKDTDTDHLVAGEGGGALVASLAAADALIEWVSVNCDPKMQTLLSGPRLCSSVGA